MTPWLVILAIGTATYLFRVSMIVVASRTAVPPAIERAARHAPTVSFAAIAAAGIGGAVTFSAQGIAPLVGALAAVVAVRRSGSPHAALAVGMPVVWLVSMLVGLR
jgi:branched-subunit amino acid transport protein